MIIMGLQNAGFVGSLVVTTPTLLAPTLTYSGTNPKSLNVKNNDSVAAIAHWSWYNDMDYTSGSGTTTIAAGATVAVTTVPWDALDSYSFDAYMTAAGYNQSTTVTIYF